MAKAKTKKKVDKEIRVKGVRGLNGLTVNENWLKAFGDKKIKTAAQCTAFMKSQFPNRESAIYNFPTVVQKRANRGLLTHGKIPKPLYKKYAS